MSKSSLSTSSHTGFFYSQQTFQQLVTHAVQYALKVGVSDACAEISEGCGLGLSVRKGLLENVERSRGKSLGITVYLGNRSGHASTSDFSLEALERTVLAARDIAQFTAQDEFASLPDPDDLAPLDERRIDLDIFHPWHLDPEHAKDIALAAENAAIATSALITNSEGASISTSQSHFFMANTRGFSDGYAQSRHTISVSPIASSGQDMERDSWFSSKRHPDDLTAPAAIGRYAAERVLSRLNARKIPTMECPVLFEPPLAAGLLGSFVHAVSGSALYRKSSFLQDSLGKQIFPQHIQILEDPFIKRAMGSTPFDAEGVRVRARNIVEDGRVCGYFLSSYSARKLGMRTTGNAGGSHNLIMSSTNTAQQDDLNAMLQKLNHGLFITELMGQGVNYVTGDYSRGASGYWVENGVIAYPIHEITLASNLLDMFEGIQAIGADTYVYGAKCTGSILINRMKIAGN